MYNDIAPFYDQIFPLNQNFLAFIPAYLGEPGTRVLDLGCGPGDYVATLTHLGYCATGIDPSTEMIRAAQREKGGTFLNFGFSDLHRLGELYDCIFSIGNSLSYHPEDQMDAFYRDLFRLLSPGGAVVLQVVNWDRYREFGPPEFDVKTLSDKRTFHRSYQPGSGGSVIFKTELQDNGETLNSWSAPLYPKYSQALRQGIQEAGLSVLAVFSDFQGSPYQRLTSPATVLTARKMS